MRHVSMNVAFICVQLPCIGISDLQGCAHCHITLAMQRVAASATCWPAIECVADHTPTCY